MRGVHGAASPQTPVRRSISWAMRRRTMWVPRISTAIFHTIIKPAIAPDIAPKSNAVAGGGRNMRQPKRS